MGVVLRGSWCAGGVAAAGSDASAGAGLARGVALGHEGQDRNGSCHQGENRAAQRPGGAQGEVASGQEEDEVEPAVQDRKSTRLNSSHANISYAVFCLKKKKKQKKVYIEENVET